MASKTGNLKLSKVLKGRESWRGRSNQYQIEKRKLQDKNRCLIKADQELKEKLQKADERNKCNETRLKEVTEEIEALKKKIQAQDQEQ